MQAKWLEQIEKTNTFDELMPLFCSWLDTMGFRYIKSGSTIDVPAYLRDRYGDLPNDYLAFFHLFSTCENDAQTAWFLTQDCYLVQEETAFSYCEFEQISLNGCLNKKDALKVKAFWNAHFPIYMSLHNGYAYYGMCVETGEIVCGYEPMFEEPEVVADSFLEFLKKVLLGEIIL
ncbi:SMI1/KNR4 family protein [Listeria costaricensis]|uniref:SMI1/KNR4 family protein n=1 Tax=Listeria costaricensis TaxID=2026604 RepID=UPI000C084796|nr:SMI1/KNR4 family protein [Listeria costaricensis]